MSDHSGATTLHLGDPVDEIIDVTAFVGDWALYLYVPMARGFVYLAAAVCWFNRNVLAWRLSITMDVALHIEAVEEALVRYGKPYIFKSDYGSQFTSVAFTDVLKKHEIAISMDGKDA